MLVLCILSFLKTKRVELTVKKKKFCLSKPGAFSRVWREKRSVWHLFCWIGKQQIQTGAGIVAYSILTQSLCTCRMESYVNRSCFSKVFKCAMCLGGQDPERGDITRRKPLSPNQLYERGMIHPQEKQQHHYCPWNLLFSYFSTPLHPFADHWDSNAAGSGWNEDLCVLRPSDTEKVHQVSRCFSVHTCSFICKFSERGHGQSSSVWAYFKQYVPHMPSLFLTWKCGTVFCVSHFSDA